MNLSQINKIRAEIGLPALAADPMKLQRERQRRANLAARAEAARALKSKRSGNKK
jgi:hypothetical protein